MLDLIQSTLNRQFSDVAEGLGEMAEILDYGSSFLSGGLWKTSDAQALQASPEIGQGANGVRDKTERDVGNTVFTAPICDLFIEVFDLDESSWLKRQAIVVILQQFLGSTIERYVVHNSGFRVLINGKEFLDMPIESLKLTTLAKSGIRYAVLPPPTRSNDFSPLSRTPSSRMAKEDRPARNVLQQKRWQLVKEHLGSWLCSFLVSLDLPSSNRLMGLSHPPVRMRGIP